MQNHTVAGRQRARWPARMPEGDAADTHRLPLKRRGLFVCESEIAQRLSQSAPRWRALAPKLEREGLPKIDPLMGGRYWPAVVAFFNRRYGLDKGDTDSPILVSAEDDGEECWEE